MKNCSIPFDAIVTFYEGRSAPETEAQVRQHLEAGCPHCQEHLAWIRQYLPALHSAVTEETLSAPASALNRARQIARDRRPVPIRPPLLERVAQLLFDSLQPVGLAAARGSAGPEAQKLYATEEHYIEVWIERMQEGGYYLIGQMLSKRDRTPALPQSVTLIAENGRRTQARQEGIEFHLASVDPGVYQMRLRLEEEEILLPEVLVGK